MTASDAVTTRRAETEDAPTLAETMRQGFETFREWTPAGWDPPGAVHEAERIREGLARPDAWCLLAVRGEEPAGHVAFVAARRREEPRELIEGLAHLWMLFVRRPWWGTGLADRLHGLAVEEAARHGYGEMRLHTPAGQGRARAFYERAGWSTDGVPIPEPMLGLDLVEYRRPLVAPG